MKVELSAGGVAFYDGKRERPEDLEIATFIDAVEHGKELGVKPEEALVVSEVLEAIYKSAEIGQVITF